MTVANRPTGGMLLLYPWIVYHRLADLIARARAERDG